MSTWVCNATVTLRFVPQLNINVDGLRKSGEIEQSAGMPTRFALYYHTKLCRWISMKEKKQLEKAAKPEKPPGFMVAMFQSGKVNMLGNHFISNERVEEAQNLVEEFLRQKGYFFDCSVYSVSNIVVISHLGLNEKVNFEKLSTFCRERGVAGDAYGESGIHSFWISRSNIAEEVANYPKIEVFATGSLKMTSWASGFDEGIKALREVKDDLNNYLHSQRSS